MIEVLWSLILKSQNLAPADLQGSKHTCEGTAGLNTPKRTSFDKAFWH